MIGFLADEWVSRSYTRTMWTLDKPAKHVCEEVLGNAKPGSEAVESIENKERLVDVWTPDVIWRPDLPTTCCWCKAPVGYGYGGITVRNASRFIRPPITSIETLWDDEITLNHVEQRLLSEEMMQQDRYHDSFKKGIHGVFWRKSEVQANEIRRTEPQVWRERLHEKTLQRRVQLRMSSVNSG